MSARRAKRRSHRLARLTGAGDGLAHHIPDVVVVQGLLLVRDELEADLEGVLRLRRPAAPPAPPTAAVRTSLCDRGGTCQQERGLRGATAS